MRRPVLDAKRIVVKVGSSSLTTAAGGIDPERVSALVDALGEARKRGTEVVLVSSGAIAAGLAPLGLTKRPRALAAQQAAASVGQGLLVHRYTEELARHGLTAGQVLLTVDDVTRRSHYRNALATLGKLLELGVLPIVNENDTVATSEIRFGDNDRLAALVAHLVHADLLVLLSDVDGLYDAPPTTPGARRIEEVTALSELDGVVVGKAGKAGVGTGGMVTKLDAARIAVEAGIPVVLTSAEEAAAALAGESTGTLFHATGRRQRTRLLWLAHATEPAGSVTIDAGAVRALTDRGASLLAAGVTGASGGFHAGDPVDLVGPDGAVVARGLVAYDVDEIPQLVGRSSQELEADLGAAYAREVVHRDDLVLL
ncbi:glutamate 5-kinase [Nocardioides terrae]|uniref:Glutamate 5-kinase n=1 Tax=Nocardioides terrae TaxID=574651 RepID=A0A1I1IX45_9ACTN|nr:glutamate 5-kinase [Nocardioides terrae]SFC38908.1 glutamate 5-kinase [Nocardioides terrae]